MSTLPSRRPERRVAISLVGLALIGLLLVACGTGSALAPVGGAVDEQSKAGGPAAQPAPAGQPETVSRNGSTTDLYDINEANLLIIKTGTMNLQVSGIDAALAAAAQKITSLGGYASGSQRDGDGEAASAQVTYRIPAARWDEALVALRALSIKVLGEQSATQDVTGQVVDLGARITNLQATEQALQGIMKQATKIADVLAVQQQLTDVRGQIEELTAQRKHLQEQAAFSSLTVNYSLKEQAVIETSKNFDPGSEVDRASASLVDVLQGVATAGIWFGIVWLPILIALGIVVVVGLFFVRRFLPSRPSGPDGGWLPPSTPADVVPTPSSES